MLAVSSHGCTGGPDSGGGFGLEMRPTWRLANLDCDGEYALHGDRDGGLFDEGRIGPSVGFNVYLPPEEAWAGPDIVFASKEEGGERTIGTFCSGDDDGYFAWYAVMPGEDDDD